MASLSRSEEIRLVDDFLADEKTLFGRPPEFGQKRTGQGKHVMEAIWPIANSDGIVAGGELRFQARAIEEKPLSIAVVFRSNCVWRVDYVDNSICHYNPLWAGAAGLSPSVCGPHFHPWEPNRDHILKQSIWDLPCRIALPPQVRRLEQALPWLASEINIVLTPDDRLFGMPDALF